MKSQSCRESDVAIGFWPSWKDRCPTMPGQLLPQRPVELPAVPGAQAVLGTETPSVPCSPPAPMPSPRPTQQEPNPGPVRPDTTCSLLTNKARWQAPPPRNRRSLHQGISTSTLCPLPGCPVPCVPIALLPPPAVQCPVPCLAVSPTPALQCPAPPVTVLPQ
ncbi:uncharacterized protein LOC143683201 isoform X2 [Tamandua tetradactyla]